MKTKYAGKYRTNKPFSRWTKFNNLIGDGFVAENGIPICRYFRLDTDEMIYFPYDAEVWFSRERQISIAEKMSRDAKTQIITE